MNEGDQKNNISLPKILFALINICKDLKHNFDFLFLMMNKQKLPARIPCPAVDPHLTEKSSNPHLVNIAMPLLFPNQVCIYSKNTKQKE